MIGAMRQPQIYKILLIFFLAGQFLGCSSLRLAPQETPRALEASFFSMGTRWNFSTTGVSPEKFQNLKAKLTALALLYEETFSDWSESSELRKLEKSGLGNKQVPSALFWDGLLLAKDAYLLSHEKFDITIGDVQWKLRKFPYGLKHLKVDTKEKSFSFSKPVKRLTFGGIAKGMALGDMAEMLLRSGIQEFRIDAGGGNIVEANRNGELKFVSKSRIFASGSASEIHIFDPNSKMSLRKNLDEQIELHCSGAEFSRGALMRLGALSDALSTALLLDKTIPMLAHCKLMP